MEEMDCEMARQNRSVLARASSVISSAYVKTDEYNFGTLLRLKASSDYSEENSMFGQFGSLNGRSKLTIDQ